MGQTPEDENYDEWMNSSAEEWSKPEEPVSKPEQPAEPTDRWGSPISSKEQQDDPRRWGSDQPAPTPRSQKPGRKGKFPWWIILIIVLVVVCLCSCVVVGGLELLGVLNIF
jgi:hypothetical protein